MPSGDERDEREEDSSEAAAFEKHRKNYIEILRNLRRKYPDALMEELEAMAREEILNQGPKSRAYYRSVRDISHHSMLEMSLLDFQAVLEIDPHRLTRGILESGLNVELRSRPGSRRLQIAQVNRRPRPRLRRMLI